MAEQPTSPSPAFDNPSSRLTAALRDPQLCRSLLDRLQAALDGRSLRFMEVCGTHTVSIFQSGLRSLLPEQVRHLSGPGCPVCVTHDAEVAAFLDLAGRDGIILATFGDLLRVPGPGGKSLKHAKAQGARVEIVYSPLDALCALMKAHPEIRPDTVKSIRVKTYRVSVDITSALKCSTEDEAKFSLPYCFAVQIAFGRVGLKQFSPEVRSDEKILNLARRVEVVEDPEATALFPRRVATVEVELVDGTRLTEKRLNASDEADASLVEAKFMEAAESIGEAASRELVEIVRRIDELENLESITAVLSKL